MTVHSLDAGGLAVFSLPKVLDGASAESSLLNALGSPRIVREVQGTAVDRLKLRVGHAHLFDTTVPTCTAIASAD